jgi:hypothetical protein
VTKNLAWPPVVGSTVRIKDTPFSGTVIKTKGVYEARFQIVVPSDTTVSGAAAQRATRRAARLASRWYGLEELEPLGG